MTRQSRRSPKATGHIQLGPWGWENWKAQQQGLVPHSAFEIACYTDATLSGEAIIGPYQLLENYLDDPSARLQESFRMGLVLRIEHHRPVADQDAFIDEAWEQTDPRVFHGGDGAQELASLLSLALGVRLKAGGIVRVFDPAGDPRGRPYEYQYQVPYLPPSGRWAILPAVTRTPGSIDVSLERSVPLLSGYAGLSAQQAIALVRAARSYQEAIWMAESDPRQAWLRLVVAVETAARQWAPGARPTKRFVDFCMALRPSPPRRRPRNKDERVDWRRMSEHLRTIYRYRSKDLHDGIPFPTELCEPPWQYGGRVPNERPIAPRAPGRPAPQTPDDMPMLLHAFEYIVRGALQAWWESMAAAPSTGR
jgi:hypothetical protein